jgi:hypothetical protein
MRQTFNWHFMLDLILFPSGLIDPTDYRDYFELISALNARIPETIRFKSVCIFEELSNVLLGENYLLNQYDFHAETAQLVEWKTGPVGSQEKKELFHFFTVIN